LKILIVDDEEDTRSLFEQRFRRESRAGRVSLLFCASAEAALALLQSGAAADVVLLLTDVNMPGMSGIELLRRIRETDAKLRVILITAYDDEEKRQQAATYGADDYVTKPIDFEELKTRILGSAENA